MTSSPELAAAISERLINSKVYSNSGPVEQIQNDLEGIRQLDSASEEASGESMKLVGYAVGGGLLSALVVVMSTSMGGTLGVLLGVSGGIGVVVSIGIVCYGVSMRVKHGKTDFENRRYEVPARLLRLLAVDAKDNDPFTCQIDFRAHNDGQKLLRKGTAGHWNVEYFVSQWFNLTGRLADGTKLTFAATVKHQDRSRTKRSASGKLKHKSKTKTSQEYSLKLKVKAKRYPILQSILADVQKEAGSAIQLHGNAQIKSLDVTADSLSLTVVLPHGFSATKTTEPQVVQSSVNLAASMMLSLYKILNLSKAIEKA